MFLNKQTKFDSKLLDIMDCWERKHFFQVIEIFNLLSFFKKEKCLLALKILSTRKRNVYWPLSYFLLEGQMFN